MKEAVVAIIGAVFNIAAIVFKACGFEADGTVTRFVQAASGAYYSEDNAAFAPVTA